MDAHLTESEQNDKRKRGLGLVLMVALVLVVVGAFLSLNGPKVSKHVSHLNVNNMVTKAQIKTPEGDISIVEDYDIPDMSCTQVNGKDLFGNDLVHYGNIHTLERCQNACKLNAECRCYTYWGATHNCYLKKGPCNNFGTNNALTSGLCRGTNRNALKCTENQHADLPGSDIAFLTNIASIGACQSQCRVNLNCRCYTYRFSDKRCWLKDGQCTNYNYNHAVSSGVCTGECYP